MSKGVEAADRARSGRPGRSGRGTGKAGPEASRTRPQGSPAAGSPTARPERGGAKVTKVVVPSVTADVPGAELLHEAAETFAMLASPTRLHLLWLLSRGESDVGTLAEAVDGSDAMVSQHLAKLRLADLVTSRREGKRQIYVVDDEHVTSLIEQALRHHGQKHQVWGG